MISVSVIASEGKSVIYVDDAVSRSVDKTLEETKGYILKVDKNPGYGSEWFVLGMARLGEKHNSEYFQTYYKNIASYIQKKDGKLHPVKSSEYSKMILVLTAIGKDAEDVAGYNLLEGLADFNQVMKQGFNGPVWALIALKSNPKYCIPTVPQVTMQTTEDLLVSYILGKELQRGGWSLTGRTPEVDMTAMTLQALAPYYGMPGYEKVTEAVDRGLSVLSSLQNPATGGFQNMGSENLESCAQVIVALTTLGISPETDIRFVKNRNWTVSDLLSYHVADGGFMHIKKDETDAVSGIVNGVATEQGFYALVAYQRFLDGKTPLYDMSDMTLQKGEKVELIEETIWESSTNYAQGNQETKSEKKAGKTKVRSVSDKDVTETSGFKSQKSSGEKETEIQVSKINGKNKIATPVAVGDEKKESESQSQESKKGWQFVGEDYSSEDTAFAENRMQIRKETGKAQQNSNVIWFIIGGTGVLGAGGAVIYLYRRRKKLERIKVGKYN